MSAEDGAFAALVRRIGAFHITDRAMKQAQSEAENTLATGFDDRVVQRYLAAAHRYFDGFEKEARGHMRDLDRRIEHINQVQFNLSAERAVAVKRIEATQGVLADLATFGIFDVMNILDRVGKSTMGFFEYAGGVAILFSECVGFIVTLRIRFVETIQQCYFLGVQSIWIVLLTSLFTGMVISLESAIQAVSLGVGNLVGGAVAYGAVRELGPMLTGVVVAGRVGAAIAAELGSMVVTEQIEALTSMGLEPARFLVVPRLVALMVMLPLLTVFADVVAVVGGMWVAQGYAHISFDTFLVSARQAVGFEDVLKGILKGFVFAIIIAMIGSYQGLRTTGGAAGVGKATTGAVVTAIILIFGANVVLSIMLFGSN